MSPKDLLGNSRQVSSPAAHMRGQSVSPPAHARLLVHANASTRQKGAGCHGEGIWEQCQEAGGRKALLFPLLMG